jgi:hypothetical protein
MLVGQKIDNFYDPTFFRLYYLCFHYVAVGNAMKTVYKYLIWKGKDQKTITIPMNARILSVKLNDSNIVFWALVDTDNDLIIRRIFVAGTGWKLPEDIGYNYDHIDTIFDNGVVWHIFIEKEK